MDDFGLWVTGVVAYLFSAVVIAACLVRFGPSPPEGETEMSRRNAALGATLLGLLWPGLLISGIIIFGGLAVAYIVASPILVLARIARWMAE